MASNGEFKRAGGIPEQTWGTFKVEKITIDATTQEEVDCSDYEECVIVSSASFTISEASDGAEYPVGAGEHFPVRHSKMSTFYLNGTEAQEIFIMWGLL